MDVVAEIGVLLLAGIDVGGEYGPRNGRFGPFEALFGAGGAVSGDP